MTTTNTSSLSGLVSTQFTGVFEKSSKRGIKFIVRYTIDKQTRVKMVGYAIDGMTAQKASLKRLQLMHDTKYRELENKKEHYEFISLYDGYLAYRRPMIAYNTYKNLNSHKTAYYEKIFGYTDVRSINYLQLQMFINKILETKKPATVEKIANGIKCFFRYLHNEGIISKNVAAKITIPKYDNKKYFMLPDHKIQEIVNYIFSIKNPTYKMIFLFLLHGRRINEVLTLRWQYIDFQNKRYTINYTYSKNRKSQYFALEEHMLVALKDLNMNTVFLFENPKKNKPITYTTVFRQMHYLRDYCKVPHMTIHDFRHLIGFLGINRGEGLETIGAILGHTNIQSTQRYSTLKISKAQKAYNKIFKSFLYK